MGNWNEVPGLGAKTRLLTRQQASTGTTWVILTRKSIVIRAVAAGRALTTVNDICGKDPFMMAGNTWRVVEFQCFCGVQVMATMKAYHGINSLTLDLNFYSRYFHDDVFYDNQYLEFGGKSYQDIYAVNGWDGGDTDLIVGFGGTGFGFDARGNVTRGTVTGIFEAVFDGPDLWSASGFSVSAKSVFQVTLTAGNADDRALLASMMGQGDTVNLSRFDDRFEGWGGNDRMSGHGGNDTLIGGTGNDTLDGGADSDRLLGGAGQDRLVGAAGGDRLEGGSGNDRLEGGLGRDLLFGGSDSVRDVFIFRARTETAVGAQRDKIFDFRAGQDDIDLSLIDANTARAGDQAFAFAGTTAAAHSVWHVKQDGGVLVRGDLNGNRTADFEIWVDDVARLGTTDFIL